MRNIGGLGGLHTFCTCMEFKMLTVFTVNGKITFSILVFATSHDLLNLPPDMNKWDARHIRTVFVLLNLNFQSFLNSKCKFLFF